MNRYIALQKIIELGGFTKAANALGYTQSSISQMIASLENELSMKLLTRSRHGVKLTIEGEELYPFIERSIYQYQSMREKANEIKGLETGIIRVGTISSITCHWMPQLIKGFKEQYPNVQFLFHQGDYTLIPEWIRAGAIDFGFITPYASTDLQTKVIKDGEMLAVLPKSHPLAAQKSVQLFDIAKEPFILPMVEAGLGVSILAELMLRRTNFNNVCLPIDPPINRTLAVAYKDRDSLPIASKYFIDYLMKHKDELA